MKTWFQSVCSISVQTCLMGLCAVLLPALALPKATVVTLPELVKESEVIVYGHIDTSTSHSKVRSSGPLKFLVAGVLKGASSVRSGAVLLCNSRPNIEWPDLSKLTGEAVLFLLPSKGCLDLSHNYRSVIKIHDDQVDTLVIEGQPENQLLGGFIEKIRSFASSTK